MRKIIFVFSILVLSFFNIAVRAPRTEIEPPSDGDTPMPRQHAPIPIPMSPHPHSPPPARAETPPLPDHPPRIFSQMAHDSDSDGEGYDDWFYPGDSDDGEPHASRSAPSLLRELEEDQARRELESSPGASASAAASLSRPSWEPASGASAEPHHGSPEERELSEKDTANLRSLRVETRGKIRYLQEQLFGLEGEFSPKNEERIRFLQEQIRRLYNYTDTITNILDRRTAEELFPPRPNLTDSLHPRSAFAEEALPPTLPPRSWYEAQRARSADEEEDSDSEEESFAPPPAMPRVGILPEWSEHPEGEDEEFAAMAGRLGRASREELDEQRGLSRDEQTARLHEQLARREEKEEQPFETDQEWLARLSGQIDEDVHRLERQSAEMHREHSEQLARLAESRERDAARLQEIRQQRDAEERRRRQQEQRAERLREFEARRENINQQLAAKLAEVDRREEEGLARIQQEIRRQQDAEEQRQREEENPRQIREREERERSMAEAPSLAERLRARHGASDPRAAAGPREPAGAAGDHEEENWLLGLVSRRTSAAPLPESVDTQPDDVD